MMTATLSNLRHAIARMESRSSAFAGPDPSFNNKNKTSTKYSSSLAIGVETLDGLFAGHGLADNSLHEIHAPEARAAGAATGFLAGLLVRLAQVGSEQGFLDQATAIRSAPCKPLLWVQDPASTREIGYLHAPGLYAFGLDPRRVITVAARSMAETLWALEEGLSCQGIGAVVGDMRGHSRVLDLTATRRLALRAEKAQRPVLFLKTSAPEDTSAARSRWRVAPAPSRPLAGFQNGIGNAAWRLELTKNRMAQSEPGLWNGIIMTNPSASSHPPTPSRRILALWLPRLPTDRLARSQWGPSWRSDMLAKARPVTSHSKPAKPEPRPDRTTPRGVYARKKNALRLTAIDGWAHARGLTVGLTLADARARVPDLDAVEEDCQADQVLLEAIADWCDRYTPLVALDSPEGLPKGLPKDLQSGTPDGLLLDVSGCAHLFGGEAALLEDMLTRLKAQGFAARGAIAGTLAAASALARYGRFHKNTGLIVPPGGERDAIAPLPLAALRLEADSVDALAQVGLRTIADLAGRPRGPLAARFGLALITRLDAALGDGGETLSPRHPTAGARRRAAFHRAHHSARNNSTGDLVPKRHHFADPHTSRRGRPPFGSRAFPGRWSRDPNPDRHGPPPVRPRAHRSTIFGTPQGHGN